MVKNKTMKRKRGGMMAAVRKVINACVGPTCRRRVAGKTNNEGANLRAKAELWYRQSPRNYRGKHPDHVALEERAKVDPLSKMELDEINELLRNPETAWILAARGASYAAEVKQRDEVATARAAWYQGEVEKGRRLDAAYRANLEAVRQRAANARWEAERVAGVERVAREANAARAALAEIEASWEAEAPWREASAARVAARAAAAREANAARAAAAREANAARAAAARAAAARAAAAARDANAARAAAERAAAEERNAAEAMAARRAAEREAAERRRIAEATSASVAGAKGTARKPLATDAEIARAKAEQAAAIARILAAPDNDYYNILGLARGASEEAIKAAHKALSLQVHPDKGGDSTAFRKVMEARNVLLGLSGGARGGKRSTRRRK